MADRMGRSWYVFGKEDGNIAGGVTEIFNIGANYQASSLKSFANLTVSAIRGRWIAHGLGVLDVVQPGGWAPT